MTVSESASGMIAHAEGYRTNSHGIADSADSVLGQGIQTIEQIALSTQDSIGIVAGFLGTSHPSFPSLNGLANETVSKSAAVQEAINVAINRVMELSQSVSTYANTVIAVGENIIRSN